MTTTTIYVSRVTRGGERVPDSCDIEGDWQKQLSEIAENQELSFTAEILSTGHVSLCLENHELGDFMCKIATNGPGPKSPPAMLAEMLREWSQESYDCWCEANR